MAGYSDRQDGFGLIRALSRVCKPGVPDGSSEHAGSGGGVRRKASSRGRTPAEMAEAQASLKDERNQLELWPLPGLAPMTRVRTSFGDVHAIALRKGDEVLLRSGAYERIQWIDRIMLDEHILSLKSDSNPIVVAPGSFGPGVPSREIMVSPRQVFCADERSGLSKPREASMLLTRSGVRRLRETGLTYTMFHVGQAADVYCEGLYLRFPMES